MKNSILLIATLIILINASFALGAFSIPETSVELVSSAPGSATGMITLSNTGTSSINATFSGTTMVCLTNPSETLNINILSPFPLPANSSIPASLSITVPSGKFACRYYAGLTASSTAGSDGVNVYLNVTPAKNLAIQNTTETLVRNLSDSKTMNVALVNSGNTDLFFTYSYTNFSKGSSVLVRGGAGATIISHGTTQYIPVSLSIPSGISDGAYTSTLTLTGDINKTATLTVTVKSPVLDASVPEFLMQDSERNKTISKKFKIKNTGDYDLNSIDVTTDADSKYNVTISDISSSLASGAEMDVNVTAFIPADETTTSHKIGNIYFDSDMIDKTVDLKLNVISKLKIDYVDVKINDNSKKVEASGEIVEDDENYPGSSFSAEMEICNEYADNDNEITDITVDATFTEVDDGDDIDGSVDEFDLEGGECAKKTIEFDKNEISPLSDSGTYDLIITVEGDDDFGGVQETEWTIPVRIVRDDDPHLVFDEVSISPSEITCDRNMLI